MCSRRGSGVVTVGIDVTPGNVFSSLLDADGTTPIGTNVRASAAARFAVFAFEHQAHTQRGIERCAAGRLPQHAGHGRSRNRSGIAASEGVAPLRWSLEPRGAFESTHPQVRSSVRSRRAAAAPGGRPVAVANMQHSIRHNAAQFARALMGGDALTASQVKAADRNGNGTLDIGDLRALVRNAPLGRSGGHQPGAERARKWRWRNGAGANRTIGERDSGDHRNDA